MPGRTEPSRTSQTLIALASLVVIIAGMRAATDLIVPFLLSAFLAVISLPPLVWLKRRNTPNWLSMLLVASAFVLVSFLVAVMVRNSMTGLTSKLGEYQHKVNEKISDFKKFDPKTWFESLKLDDLNPDKEESEQKESSEKTNEKEKAVAEKTNKESTVKESDTQSGQAKSDNATSDETGEDATKEDATAQPKSNAPNQPLTTTADDPTPDTEVDQKLTTTPPGPTTDEPSYFDFFNTDNLFRIFTGTVTGMTGLLSNAFLILLTVIFILLEAATIPAKLNAMPEGSTFSVDNMVKIIDNVNRYMAIKTLTSLATAVLVGTMLAVIGVPFAMFWALLSFFLNFVPNIGSFLAAIPAILVAYLDLNFGAAISATIGYVIINVLIGNVVEPRVMGQGLGLSTLVVFVSLIFWGWVLGPVGMLLSVPLTMTAKIALESNPETKWIGVMLGTGSPAPDTRTKSRQPPRRAKRKKNK